MNFNTYPIISG